MIARLWRGWTTSTNSKSYASLFVTGVLPELTMTEGCYGAYVFRRAAEGAEMEFAVLMLFEDIRAVERLAGADYERAVIPTEARALLSRYDERAVHYDTVAHVTRPIVQDRQADDPS